MKFVPANPIIN